MGTTERVTVTLPTALLRDIDRIETNRSRFVAEAVEHELDRRRREGLLTSIANPHEDSSELADAGLADWADLVAADTDLVDPAQGRAVRWVPGKGWVEG